MVAVDENQIRPDPNSVKNHGEKSQGLESLDNSAGEQEDSRGSTKRKAYEFSKLSNTSASQQQSNIEFILDIPLEVTVELGRTSMLIAELLKLGQGSIIELSKSGGETLDILANQQLIARGEVVIVNEKYGVRLTEIASPMERIERLK